MAGARVQSDTANPSNKTNRLREERERGRALHKKKHQKVTTSRGGTQTVVEEWDKMTLGQSCLEVEENLGFTTEEYWEIVRARQAEELSLSTVEGQNTEIRQDKDQKGETN